MYCHYGVFNSYFIFIFFYSVFYLSIAVCMCSVTAHSSNGLYKEHRRTPQSIFLPSCALFQIDSVFREITGPVKRYSLCLKHLLPAVHASLVFNVLPPVSCLLLLKKQNAHSYNQKQKSIFFSLFEVWLQVVW